MLKMDLKPLAPRQKLAIDPTLVTIGTAALAASAGFAGKAVSKWVWEHYVAPKRKSKKRVVRDIAGDFRIIQIDTIEEHIIKTKKQIRVFLKRK